jgi:hypothetical protein
MMEFILSKVVVCVLAITLMGTAMSVMENIEEEKEMDGLQDVSDGIATILDMFWHSDLNHMTIPQSAVPFTDCRVEVGNNLVTVERGDRKTSSVTDYPWSFGMGYGMDVTLYRDVPP